MIYIINIYCMFVMEMNGSHSLSWAGFGEYHIPMLRKLNINCPSTSDETFGRPKTRDRFTIMV